MRCAGEGGGGRIELQGNVTQTQLSRLGVNVAAHMMLCATVMHTACMSCAGGDREGAPARQAETQDRYSAACSSIVLCTQSWACCQDDTAAV